MVIKCSEKRDQGVSCLCAKATNSISNIPESAAIIINKSDSGTVIDARNIDQNKNKKLSCSDMCIGSTAIHIRNASQRVCLLAFAKTKAGNFESTDCDKTLSTDYGGLCLCTRFIGAGIEEELKKELKAYVSNQESYPNTFVGSSMAINLGNNRSIIGLFNGKMSVGEDDDAYDKHVCNSCYDYAGGVGYNNGQCVQDYLQKKKEDCKKGNCTIRYYPQSFSLCAGIVTPQNNP